MQMCTFTCLQSQFFRDQSFIFAFLKFFLSFKFLNIGFTSTSDGCNFND